MDNRVVPTGRRYKSRKERPCDKCRSRKVCCVRESEDQACSLCRMHGTSCRYDNGPVRRRYRAVSTPRKVDLIESGDFASPSADHDTSGEWISQYVGSSGDQDPFVLRHCDFNRSNYHRNGDWACLRVRCDGVFPSHFTLVPESHLDARPPFYPESKLLDAAFALHQELLATYFDIVHSSYPLLDPSRFAKGNTIGLPLLSVIYGLARPFCPAASKIDVPQLHSFSFRALPIEARSARLESIEAALLFQQRHNKIHRAPTMPGLYAEIGTSVGMCHDVGLNVDPTKWNIHPTEKSRRKRLWWALYINDKWAALGLGRPSYLHDEDSNVPPLPLEDVMVHTATGKPLPMISARMFVAMAALSTILSALLSTFYTLKAVKYAEHMSVDQLSSYKDYFEVRLREFYDEHVSSIGVVEDMSVDPTGTLILAFRVVELVLYRAILRRLAPTYPLCIRVRLHAQEVVLSISNLLETLQDSRLKAFWWSPMSRINFAMAGGFLLSMLLSSVSEEDISHWAAETERYRRLLDQQSLFFDTTKLAAVRMSLLATVSNPGKIKPEAEHNDPKQAFCRDFGVELNVS